MPFQCHVPICSPISYALLVIYIFNMQIERHSCTSEACPWHPRSLLEAYLCILTKSKSLWGHSSRLAVFYKLRLFPSPLLLFFVLLMFVQSLFKSHFFGYLLCSQSLKKKVKRKEKHNLNISTTTPPPLSLPRELRLIYIAVECEDTVIYSIYIILKLTVNVLEALNKFYDFLVLSFFTTENKQEKLNYYVLFWFGLVCLFFLQH